MRLYGLNRLPQPCNVPERLAMLHSCLSSQFYSSYSASLTPQKSVPKHESTAYHVRQYKLAAFVSKLPSSLRGICSPIIPCPDPINHPMIGNEPTVCCHRGFAGR